MKHFRLRYTVEADADVEAEPEPEYDVGEALMWELFDGNSRSDISFLLAARRNCAQNPGSASLERVRRKMTS